MNNADDFISRLKEALGEEEYAEGEYDNLREGREDAEGGFDFLGGGLGGLGGLFGENFNFETLSKVSELARKFREQDKNSALLLAIKPHLRPENQAKIDGAIKVSKIMSMLPELRESGVLNNLL